MTMRAEVAFGVETSRAATTATSPSTMATSLALLSRGTSRDIVEKKPSRKHAKKAVKGNLLGGALNAGDAFSLICAALYDRFEQKDEIDRRILKAFEDNIDKAPEQTDVERALVEKMLATASEIESEGKRVPGTVGESVDKFSKWNQGEASVWGITKAKVDMSAEEFFARLWVLNTYRKKAEQKDVNGDLPRAV